MTILRPARSSHRGDEPLWRAPRVPERLADAAYDLAKEFSPFIQDSDLAAAIRHLAHTWENESGVLVRLQQDGLAERIPADAMFLRVAHEALRNVELHACAERVVITLSYLPGRVNLSILDDGRGFDLAVTKAGPGLRELRERVAEFGGTLTVEAVPGHGCLLEASVPMRHAGHVERAERPHSGR